MKKTIAFITAFLITASVTGSAWAYADEIQPDDIISEQTENEMSDDILTADDVSEEEPDAEINETETSDAEQPSDNEESPSEETEEEPEEQEEEPAEVFDSEAFVRRIYRIALEREADEGGLATWLNQLNTGRMTAADVVRCIVTSGEYNRKEKSDSEYAQMMLLLMTETEASEEETAELTERLSAGYSRAEIVRVLGITDGFTRICEKYGVRRGGKDINKEFAEFAANIKTESSYEAEMLVWKLQDRNITASEVLEEFFAEKSYSDNAEGRKEYISDLYSYVLMKDEVPESDLKHWTGYLEDGLSSKFVLSGLVSSAEFTEKCASWDIERGSIALSENRDTDAVVTKAVKRIYNIIR